MMGRPIAERWPCPRTVRGELDGTWAQLRSEGGTSEEAQGKEKCHERAQAGQDKGGDMQTQCWIRLYKPGFMGPKNLLDLTLGLVLPPWFLCWGL